MKRVRAEFPYEDYWLYIVFHRKENRRMANLIRIDDIKQRKTLSYARYLMSVDKKRYLTEDEEVDHINNDKTNDELSNLQILSKEDNLKKQELYRATYSQPKTMKLVCPVCGINFDYPTRNFKHHTKNGRTRFNCSRKCAGKKL